MLLVTGFQWQQVQVRVQYNLEYQGNFWFFNRIVLREWYSDNPIVIFKIGVTELKSHRGFLIIKCRLWTLLFVHFRRWSCKTKFIKKPFLLPSQRRLSKHTHVQAATHHLWTVPPVSPLCAEVPTAQSSPSSLFKSSWLSDFQTYYTSIQIGVKVALLRIGSKLTVF